MRNTVSLVLLLSLVSSCAYSVQPASGSLCHAPETTYFSCRTTRHTMVSLCGTLPSNLQYRYGKGAQVELQFPDDPATGARQLGYAHYSRFQVERTEVTFSHVDADYAVFDYTENDRRSAGVHVTTADGRESEVRCTGPVQGQLAPLGKSLRCDSDNALNGGQCP
jgi:hypothetical protein